MASRVYEILFLLDSNRYGRDPEGVSGGLNQMIEKPGGEILVSRLWEERRLAYPIRGQRKGTYWLIYARLDSSQLVDLKRQYRLSESVLRALPLKVDPRIVDTLVAHAQSGEKATAGGGADEKKTKKAGAPAAVAVAGGEGPEKPTASDQKD